jgi:hypothetical protein
MKKVILLMLVLILGFSCNKEPLDVKIEEASFMSTLQGKGQPPQKLIFLKEVQQAKTL